MKKADFYPYTLYNNAVYYDDERLYLVSKQGLLRRRFKHQKINCKKNRHNLENVLTNVVLWCIFILDH